MPQWVFSVSVRPNGEALLSGGHPLLFPTPPPHSSEHITLTSTKNKTLYNIAAIQLLSADLHLLFQNHVNNGDSHITPMSLNMQ